MGVWKRVLDAVFDPKKFEAVCHPYRGPFETLPPELDKPSPSKIDPPYDGSRCRRRYWKKVREV